MHPHSHPHDAAQRPGEPTRVSITLLGGFEVTVDGHVTPARGWSRRTAASLVKVLALAPGRHLHREQVMDLLWPDEPPARSAPRLHKAAHFARRAAGHAEAIVLRDDVVWLFPDAEVTVDAVRFEQLAQLAAGRRDPATARDALARYRGELLPSDRYEEWTIDRRELLHLRRLDLLRICGDWRELAAADPANEEARLALIGDHVAAGAPTAALREYAHLEHVLERELGTAPSGPTRVGALLSELADLALRQRAVLAELAAAGVTAASIPAVA